MKRTNIYLTTEQLKRLEQARKKIGARSIAELIRKAVDKAYPPKRIR